MACQRTWPELLAGLLMVHYSVLIPHRNAADALGQLLAAPASRARAADAAVRDHLRRRRLLPSGRRAIARPVERARAAARAQVRPAARHGGGAHRGSAGLARRDRRGAGPRNGRCLPVFAAPALATRAARRGGRVSRTITGRASPAMGHALAATAGGEARGGAGGRLVLGRQARGGRRVDAARAGRFAC